MTIPIQTYEEWIRYGLPCRFFETDKDVQEYLWWLSDIQKNVQPLWEKGVKEKHKEFITDYIRSNPEFVKERRLEYLDGELISLNSSILFYTNKLSEVVEWMGEYIHESLIKPLFRRKKRIEYEVRGWKSPLEENGNKITKLDIERAKEVSIGDILGLEPKIKGSEKYFYLSPFREEKQPSFVWYKKTNSWFDFGESAGGDVVLLAQRLFKLEFLDAIKFLIKK